ncbi:hypothetical protein HEP87_60700 [Streptomyces sp. S1D4-11]
MSSLAAATLARAGVSEIVIANRTPDRAERLAQILNENEGGDTDVLARAVPMDSVPLELTRADIAISCTGATGLVLTAETVAAAVEGRTGESVVTAEPAAKPLVRGAIRSYGVARGRGRPDAARSHQRRHRRRLPARPVRRAGHGRLLRARRGRRRRNGRRRAGAARGLGGQGRCRGPCPARGGRTRPGGRRRRHRRARAGRCHRRPGARAPQARAGRRGPPARARALAAGPRHAP